MNFKDYYLHKVIRLLPLVSIAAVVYEIILYIYVHVYKFSWFDTKASLWGMILDCLGIQVGWSSLNPCVNNPTWYISVLLLCYLIFYLITYWSHRLKISPYYGYIFMIFVGMEISTYGVSIMFITVGTDRGYYAFFGGIIFHKFLLSDFIKMRKNILGFSVFIVVTVLMIFCWDLVNADIGYVMTFVYYPSVIIILQSKYVSKLFERKICSICDEISFNVYIWHGVLLLGIVCIRDILNLNFNWNGKLSMLIFTLFCFLAGTISYFAIEKPIKNKIESVIEYS